ncbi:hypothetical protein NX059_008062 [Plenodomus lindquistii]|nr:hypothetical protein NX059_008062 [Plenodomus lindquistii]
MTRTIPSRPVTPPPSYTARDADLPPYTTSRGAPTTPSASSSSSSTSILSSWSADLEAAMGRQSPRRPAAIYAVSRPREEPSVYAAGSSTYVAVTLGATAERRKTGFRGNACSQFCALSMLILLFVVFGVLTVFVERK